MLLKHAVHVSISQMQVGLRRSWRRVNVPADIGSDIGFQADIGSEADIGSDIGSEAQAGPTGKTLLECHTFLYLI